MSLSRAFGTTGQPTFTSSFEALSGDSAPTQTEFNAFADAMSTSYGAPIELFSVDPATGAQTELADTSTTNLLAELPVLEAQANGVNLGLQLADGTQVQFSSTARLADFLYATSVQQMQATQFVTDNYNLDTQWLNTVDQPLLNSAIQWNEQAVNQTAAGKTAQATESNIAASLALQIAGEAPASRQNDEVTISSNGTPTQVTVYTNGTCTIHSLNGGITGYIEEAVSTLVSIAAVVTGQWYLYYAAAAIDAAQAGQAFANGQDLAGILSLAEAVSAGILGGTGGTAPLGTTPVPAPTVAQTVAQEINVAAEAVGGVYGVVKSTETGNAIGILAGALEAAAAAAAGIGIEAGPGQAQQTLNLISTALGAASVVTNMGGDFASGNLAQGLVDSLNLYLPAEAAANATAQTNLSDASAGLEAEYQGANQAYTQYYANQSAQTALTSAITLVLTEELPAPPADVTPANWPTVGIAVNVAAFGAALNAAGTSLVPNFNDVVSALPASAMPSNGVSGTFLINGAPEQVTIAAGNPAVPGGSGTLIVTAAPVDAANPSGGTASGTGSSILDTIQATATTIGTTLIKFIGQSAGSALDLTVPTSTTASSLNAAPVAAMDNTGKPILDPAGNQMMTPTGADPGAVAAVGQLAAGGGGTEPGDLLYAQSLLSLFRQHGAWDFQFAGNSSFNAKFTDYSNMEIGVYGASIGMPLTELLTISDTYAALNSNMKADPGGFSTIYTHTLNTNVSDITQGYTLYNAGLIGHH